MKLVFFLLRRVQSNENYAILVVLVQELLHVFLIKIDKKALLILSIFLFTNKLELKLASYFFNF